MKLAPIKALCSSIVDVLFPSVCALCGKIEAKDEFCINCARKMNAIAEPFCFCCGRPFAGGTDSSERMCGACLISPPKYEAQRSAYLYKDEAAEAIKSLKYGHRTELAPAMGKEMIKAAKLLPDAALDIIVPVPLHINRLRERGFNQSERLGRQLSRALNVPMELYALKRVRDTVPQVSLKSDTERKANIKDAFGVADETVFRGKNVMLVDDVTTTGSTLRECAKTLKKAGAKIFCVTFAMTADL